VQRREDVRVGVDLAGQQLESRECIEQQRLDQRRHVVARPVGDKQQVTAHPDGVVDGVGESGVSEVPSLGGQHRREQRKDEQERVAVDVDVAEIQRQPAWYQRLYRRDNGPFQRVDELRDVGPDDPREVDADVTDDTVYH